LKDLYTASIENQAFLHTRFDLGDDVFKPYKATIDRWLSPDVFKNQETSVAKAKKAITDYRKAVGLSEGFAELMTYHCERAASFSDEFGLQDEAYFDALVLMFEKALKVSAALSIEQCDDFLARLDAVRDICHNFGYGVGDDMDRLLTEAGFDD